MKVLVTGSEGLLGSALKAVRAESRHDFVFAGRVLGDLEDPRAAEQLVAQAQPEAIVHAAAVVGGIQFNRDRPEEVYQRNAAINRNVLDAALRLRVPKVVSFLSTCIFPKNAPEPWDESLVHAGEPDDRHWGYAKAKRELDTMSRAYTERAQGRCRFVTLMPTTLYGPNDNYHPDRSHVLPAIILKVKRAKDHGEDVTLWGTGSPRREFVYSLDVARVALWAVEHYDGPETMIISPGSDISIRELAALIAEGMGFRGEVLWDTSKPDGTPSRHTHNAKFRRFLPDFQFTLFRDGLRATIEHFERHYPRLRGL